MSVQKVHAVVYLASEMTFVFQMPTLLNWLFKIYTKYNHVPFHNFKHCFMVSQMVSCVDWSVLCQAGRQAGGESASR